ncbi:V-set domain-containing T-cell activation inhibitor 1-like [Epinephelus fuscoguttatus]|uniref:V-set domain-containing T-cell activation inhibitor 1-like n=1 Tax=Epinephelus fuscoguttatus TaxID=293821 RepID=UPI0020D07464|nr:V-set domain-containing T-cell activation inhibitor 1-like [Epinephelus fuscoguttatus]
MCVSPGLSNVTVSQEPVKVVVGEDAILGCHLEPPLNATTLGVRWIQEVVWKRNEATVHVYRANDDSLDNQDENFRGRTSLFRDEMARGNISLKLTNVTKRDAGNYTCHVPSLKSKIRKGNVTLIVAEPREETNQGNRTNNSEPKSEPGGPGLKAKIGCGCGIGAVLLLLTCVIVAIVDKRRQTNTTDAEQNGGYELEPLRERNGENQRDSGK